MIAHGMKDSSCHWKMQDPLTEPIQGTSERCKKPSAIIENGNLLKIRKGLGQIMRLNSGYLNNQENLNIAIKRLVSPPWYNKTRYVSS